MAKKEMIKMEKPMMMGGTAASLPPRPKPVLKKVEKIEKVAPKPVEPKKED